MEVTPRATLSQRPQRGRGAWKGVQKCLWGTAEVGHVSSTSFFTGPSLLPAGRGRERDHEGKETHPVSQLQVWGRSEPGKGGSFELDEKSQLEY